MLIVNIVMLCLVLELPVVMTVMSVNVVLWFQMVFELNFQMDMTVELDFQISVMNVMALVLYCGCFLDHQTILSQCHMIVVCFRQI